VQHGAADQLHVEVAQADRAHRRLAREREHLRQHVVERLLLGLHLRAQLGHGGLDLVRREAFGPIGERVDGGDDGLVLGEGSLVGRTEQALQGLADAGGKSTDIEFHDEPEYEMECG
jgi:hypothetical protein